MQLDVPFTPNTSDDLHCLQAAYMSIAKFFDPSFSIPMDEWSKITGFEENKGTWGNAGLVWFSEHGFDVKHVSLFDYSAFVSSPEEYLIEIDGEEVGKWAIAHTNIPLEVERVKRLLTSNIIEQREATIDLVKNFLDKGYLVRIGLNAHKLDNRSGYFGHAVVVTGYDDEHVIFHDPGLPPIPNRKSTYTDFEAAWADPSDTAKEIDAIKKL